MQRLLTLAAACVLSCAMAFAQGAVTDQAPAGGTQNGTNTVNSNPNSNGTSPSNGQSMNSATQGNGSSGSSNPGATAGSEGGANGQAMQGSQGATNGSTAAPTGNAGDNSNNNGMATDNSGNNPASGRGADTTSNPHTGGSTQWLWIALGIIIALVLIGALMSRNRARTTINPRDPALGTRGRDDINNRNDQIRRVG